MDVDPRLVAIAKREYEKLGRVYNENKTVYEQLFSCEIEGCIFKNIYYEEYLHHKNADLHVWDAKYGTDFERSEKIRKERRSKD